MNVLDSSIESLTNEHTALTQKLAQIDASYKTERPQVVASLNQLAKALSALTGKPVAGASGQVGRKPMSEEGKAAIRAGLEKARAAKAVPAPTPPSTGGQPAAQPTAPNEKKPASAEKISQRTQRDGPI